MMAVHSKLMPRNAKQCIGVLLWETVARCKTESQLLKHTVSSSMQLVGVTCTVTFIARERKDRAARIKLLEEKRDGAKAGKEREEAAKKVLEAREGMALRIEDLKTLIKWKQNGKPAKGVQNKQNLSLLWESLKDTEKDTNEDWTEADVAELEHLQQATIEMSDTAVGREQQRLANATIANLGRLPMEMLHRMEEGIRERALQEAVRVTEREGASAQVEEKEEEVEGSSTPTPTTNNSGTESQSQTMD